MIFFLANTLYQIYNTRIERDTSQYIILFSISLVRIVQRTTKFLYVTSTIALLKHHYWVLLNNRTIFYLIIPIILVIIFYIVHKKNEKNNQHTFIKSTPVELLNYHCRLESPTWIGRSSVSQIYQMHMLAGEGFKILKKLFPELTDKLINQYSVRRNSLMVFW